MNLRNACTIAIAAAALAVPGAARAGDGRVEINQAFALAGGVTPFDEPGFPVDLQVGGSYVLTSDLVSASTSNAIQVRTRDPVTLDLAGFAIRGPGTCTGVGSSRSCTGLAAYGIDNTLAFTGAETAPLVVRNGRIEGFISAVISRGECSLSNLEVRFGGLSVGANDSACIVHHVSVALGGIGSSGTLLLADSLSDGDSGSGILVYEGVGSLLRNSSRRHRLDGIDARFPALAIDNAIDRNERNGVAISAQSVTSTWPSLLIGNSIYENALTISPSAQIQFLSCVTGTGYTNNVITPPAGGATVANCASAHMPPNVCNGIAWCP